ILGLGLGWREEEFRMFGQQPRERVRRTIDAVEVLRRAWTGERFSYEGTAYSFDRVKITPRPAQVPGVPIHLGGFTSQRVRRAGRLGDGYIRSRVGLDDAKRSVSLAEEGAREAGRDTARLAFAQLHNAFVWDDGDAWDVVRAGANHQLGVYEAWRQGGDTPEHDSLEVPDVDGLARDLTPAGSPSDVTKALRPWIDAFGDREEFHLIVRLHYPGMD